MTKLIKLPTITRLLFIRRSKTRRQEAYETASDQT